MAVKYLAVATMPKSCIKELMMMAMQSALTSAVQDIPDGEMKGMRTTRATVAVSTRVVLVHLLLINIVQLAKPATLLGSQTTAPSAPTTTT